MHNGPQQSAAIWAEFAHELADNTGTSVPLEQKGGYDLHFSEDTLQATVEKYETLKQQLGGDYPFEVLGHNALRKEEPHIGPKVVGAILHHQDGHANPLKLLMALAADVRRLGGRCLLAKKSTDVTRPDGFRVTMFGWNIGACREGDPVSGAWRGRAWAQDGVQGADPPTTRAGSDHRKAAQADQPPIAYCAPGR